MSNRNYTNYSKPAKQPPRPEPQDAVAKPIEPVQKTEEVAKPKKPVRGVVVGCFNLNVRTGPSKDFDVICEIPSDSEVEIDESESFEDFIRSALLPALKDFV